MLPSILLLSTFFACTGDPTSTDGPAVPLEEAVTIDALLGHLDTLQEIADANAGNRAAGRDGYLDSVDYIQAQLEEAGLVVERESFAFTLWTIDSSSFTIDGADAHYEVLTSSGSGTAEGTVTPVDLQLPPGAANSSTSGCEASDFDGFSGGIALIQRGSCNFSVKVDNAQDAGATAVVVFNEGQPGRTEVVAGQLGVASDVPVIGVSFATGQALAQGGTVSIALQTSVTQAEDENLFVEIEGSDPEAGVVMAGAHLDSVAAGAGINDNGSGTAYVLELAKQTQAAGQPVHTVRFAWWGAEEIGLLGSNDWVYRPTGAPAQQKLDALDAYLNYDMMASSNGARFVHDGDCSDINGQGCSPANGRIEQLHLEWFEAKGLAVEPMPMIIPSDIAPFVAEGVPSGGVHSGAFESKPASMVESQGGEADVPFDACYHEECDRRDQINAELYEELAQASAYVFEQLAGTPGDQGARSRRLTDVPKMIGCHEHVRLDR